MIMEIPVIVKWQYNGERPAAFQIVQVSMFERCIDEGNSFTDKGRL